MTAPGGLRLAVTTLTVFPLRPGRVDRAVAGYAMAFAPAVGLVLGAALAGVLGGLVALDASPLLAAVLAVAALGLATRGLHLDGLADTADGLGCYGDRGRALDVMRSPTTGPFAVAALVLTLLGQVAAVADLAAGHRWTALAVTVAAGRLAFPWACRRGVPAARPSGMGALVAGTLPLWVPVLWTVALGAGAVLAMPDRPWQGPLAVGAAVLVAAALTRHATRRFGGITGDTLGAACELAVLTAAAVLSLG